MGSKILIVFLCCLLLFSGFSSVSASSSPAKIVSGFVSSSLAKLMKWVWSLKTTTKTAISGRSMMKFESGYNVETVFDGRVTTIAGGKWSHRGGHVDGPSEDAKFSGDFDVVYVGSSCSLLVIDRGNRVIREIQLHFDDCAYQYESSFPLGIAVLVDAGFFGYMLALLERRVGSIVSSQNDMKVIETTPPNQYQKPLRSVRPPLIPTESESEKQEESFFASLGKLIASAGTSAMEIVGSIFPVFKKKTVIYQYQNQGYYPQPNTAWQSPESFEIPKDEEPPSIETRAPTPKKTYAFMSKDAKMQQQLRQSRVFANGWEGAQQQQQQLQQQQQKHQNRHQHHSSIPYTYYEQSFEKTDEIVFGAVQETGQRESVIRPTPYAMDSSLRYRNGYTRGYPSYS